MANALLVGASLAADERLRSEMTDAGCTVETATTETEAIRSYRSGVDLVLLDRALPDVDGLQLLGKLKAIDPTKPVLVLARNGSEDEAVSAIRAGACHYLAREQVSVLPSLARRMIAWADAVRSRKLETAGPGLAQLRGDSAQIRALRRLAARVALRDSTVLITGESGTGKDLLARGIHYESPRASGPFVNITCTALPESLLESELFGHERGAFTDARSMKRGLLEQADGGTVFLDEIGDASLGIQVKLLRFLEERAFRRVGGTSDLRPNVRVITATNRNLERAMRRGTFRHDLYYRLAVLTLHVPPLRERTGDIRLLASHFAAQLDVTHGRSPRSLSEEALELLEAHSWPGNVRELRNAIERSLLLSDRNRLTADDFELGAPSSRGGKRFELPPGGIDLRALERELVEQALERAQGNQSRAALLLGLSRDQMRYRLIKYGALTVGGVKPARAATGSEPMHEEDGTDAA